MKIRNLKELKIAKAKAKGAIDSQKLRIKSFYHIKTMKLLVPDIIRDKDNNVDFSKAIGHFVIATLPVILKKLDDSNGFDSKKVMEIIAPFIDGLTKTYQTKQQEA